MNPELSELICDGLDTSKEYLADVYEQKRQHLNNTLGGLALESFEESEAQAKALTRFVELLPQATIDNSNNKECPTVSIVVADQAQARAVQSSVVWRPVRLGQYSWQLSDYPYYILGARAAKRDLWRPVTELLLHAAFDQQTHTIPGAAYVVSTEYANTKSPRGIQGVVLKDIEAHERRSKSPFTTGQLSTVRQTNDRYVVTARSSGSTRLRHDDTVSLRAKKRDKEQEMMGLSTMKGMPLLTGRAMAELDVFDEVNHLALTFEQIDNAKRIFSAQDELEAPRVVEALVARPRLQ